MLRRAEDAINSLLAGEAVPSVRFQRVIFPLTVLRRGSRYLRLLLNIEAVVIK